jgi:hypothetical protein
MRDARCATPLLKSSTTKARRDEAGADLRDDAEQLGFPALNKWKPRRTG